MIITDRDPNFHIYRQFRLSPPKIYVQKSFSYLCASCQRGFQSKIYIDKYLYRDTIAWDEDANVLNGFEFNESTITVQ